MKKRLKITLALLVLLTLVSAMLAEGRRVNWAWFLILTLAAIKFNLVVFEFMELRSAHGFWKLLMVFYSVVFITVLGLILMH